MIEPWATFPRKTSLVSFGYTRDAAGRLASVSWDERTGRRERFRNVYDWRGRRVRRVWESSDDRGSTWDVLETREFLYDDWNLIHETRTDEIGSVTRLDYFWGPDLSGSLQGAGGVGGLVAVSVDGAWYFPGYDNNGNVIGYWDERGRLAAEFVYDAFGNPVGGHDAPYVHLPHRFSTKYHDAETDLYYYGHRYYSPSLGRWISRDPIDEDGGWLFCSCGGSIVWNGRGKGPTRSSTCQTRTPPLDYGGTTTNGENHAKAIRPPTPVPQSQRSPISSWNLFSCDLFGNFTSMRVFATKRQDRAQFAAPVS